MNKWGKTWQCGFPENENAQNLIIFSIDKAKKMISDFFFGTEEVVYNIYVQL